MKRDQIFRWVKPGNVAMGSEAIKIGKMGLDLTVQWEEALSSGTGSVTNQSFEFAQMNSTFLSSIFLICTMKISCAL